ncbi:O-antigen ligase family protein [Ramlibacter rhizophilus]|uniref:O-antigen ligase family protein n=1 Tax=Ramlibacter rhizophilus TaxID=1781167 RepID=UPI0014325416|nr:O-antigen ligase family protein [Ramlibacter rhizophilus]
MLPLLAYGTLGLSSCVTVKEPAPFDLLALLLMVAYVLRNRTDPLHRRADASSVQIVFLLLLFALLQFLPILLSAHDVATSAFFAAVTGFLVLLGIHLASLAGRRDPRFAAFIAGYAAAAVFSSLLAIASLHPAVASLAPETLHFAGRPKALFKDPNVLGPYLVPAVLIFLVLAGRTHGWTRLAFLVLHLLCSAGVAVTASRAAWVNLAIVMGLFLLLAPGRYKLLSAFAVLACATVLVTTADDLQRHESVRSTLNLLDGRLGLQHYDAERFEMAHRAWRIGMDNPAGVGPGLVTTYRGDRTLAPHNTYLRIFAEHGAAGLVALAFALLMVTMRVLGQLLRSGRGRGRNIWFTAALCMLAGLLVNASVVDALHWRHFWLVLAVGAFVSAQPAATAAVRWSSQGRHELRSAQ